MNLSGKTAVVTGGASGIGKCLVESLLENGAVVWAWDVSLGGLEVLGLEAKRYGRELTTEIIDVTDEAALRAARDRILDSGKKIDFWFNNAGVAGLGGFMDLKPADVDKVIAINLGGVISGTRLALEHMESRGSGVIVNMASVAGHIAAPYMSIYAATKHAVVGFTRAVREELELRDSPVKLVLVSPGFADTAIISRGERVGFPEWLSWALSTPERVSQEILEGIEKGREEIYPTLNGRVMLKAYGLFPRLTRKSSRMLLVRRFRDLLLNRYTVD